ncbi:hypothetical protein [Clostridium sp. YIM B02500]|nr:hypothetical protein [Clostridium sp. YIM B02500]
MAKKSKRIFEVNARKTDMAIRLLDQRRGKLTEDAVLKGMDYK